MLFSGLSKGNISPENHSEAAHYVPKQLLHSKLCTNQMLAGTTSKTYWHLIQMMFWLVLGWNFCLRGISCYSHFFCYIRHGVHLSHHHCVFYAAAIRSQRINLTLSQVSCLSGFIGEKLQIPMRCLRVFLIFLIFRII